MNDKVVTFVFVITLNARVCLAACSLGTLPEGLNADISISGRSTGGRAIYECQPGFVPENATLMSVICNDPNWLPADIPAGTIGKCVAGCSRTRLPTITNGAPTLVAGQSIKSGENVIYTCNSPYVISPQGATPQVNCLADGNFTAPSFTCVYNIPLSCGDYYRRKGLCGKGPRTDPVEIDTDGPGINPPFQVTCSLNGANACTDVNPNPVPAASAVNNCAGGNFTPVFDSRAPGYYLRVCGNVISVTYNLNTIQLNDLISKSSICTQQMSISCINAVGNFVFVKRNNQSNGRTYNSANAGVVFSDVTIGGVSAGFPDDACDCQTSAQGCGLTGASTTSSSCRCSSTGQPANGVDTITKYLTPSSPNYVTHYGVAKRRYDFSPFPYSSVETAVSVGPVTCCECCA